MPVAKKQERRAKSSELRKGRDAERAKHLKQKIKVSVPVPEGLAKSWQIQNVAEERRKALAAKKAAAKPALLAKQALRVRTYEAQYRADKKDRQLKEKRARLAGNLFKAADPKVLVVIRIRGINRMSPKARKVLQLFRLLQIHNAVFVKVNKATVNMLKVVQPYVAYGYPNVSTIRALVYKRGFAKIRHKPGAISRIPIMSNDLIAAHLGKCAVEDAGVETAEDLIYQIHSAGEHFRQCTNFLWPFKLNCPRGGYRGRKRRHFNEGGSYGNWEFHINNFVMRML